MEWRLEFPDGTLLESDGDRIKIHGSDKVTVEYLESLDELLTLIKQSK